MKNLKNGLSPIFYLSVLLGLSFGSFNSLCVGLIDYDKFAKALEGVFQKQSDDYNKSMAEFADKISEAMAKSLKEVIDHTAGDGTNTLFENLDKNFGPDSKGEAALKNCLNTFFAEIETQLKQEGKGQQAIQNLFTDLGAEYGKFLLEIAKDRKEFFKEGGEFQQLLWQAEKQAIDPANDFMVRVWQRNWIISGAITIFVVAGATVAYHATKHWIERNWIRPKLIVNSPSTSFFQKLKVMLGRKKQVQDMVFEKDLETRLHDIVKTTQTIYQKVNSGASNVKYRNLMLWGPPGTGKTMFAKRLAQTSGLDLAYIPGSSFAKFKDSQVIEALDGLFTWANKSKGLMIFLDEAEAFLAKRESMNPKSTAYQLFDRFLHHTGQRSNKFMIVFATNHKDSIDSAMHRRIDDLVELPLPKASERARVLALYRNIILLDVKQNGQNFVDVVQKYLDDEKIDEIAQRTEGLSNGDLEGIINTIKTDADITDSGLVNAALVERAVQRAIEKHQTFTSVLTTQ